MNILDGLLGEHAALLTLFEHLEQNAAHMDLERLHETGALLERVVMVHSMAEDRFLFDAVTTSEGGLRDALLAMRSEHKQLAQELDQFRGSVSEAAARGCLRRVLDGIREHFEVEERVLFPVAARQISPQKLEELGTGWKRSRMREALP
jgi:hemerythrin-like domain-containing protein